MDVPTSSFAVAVVVALVVPGIVYAGTRAAMTGYRGTDKALGTKLIEAVSISVVLDAAYLLVARGWLGAGLNFRPSGEEVLVTVPLPVGLNILGFAVAAPIALAVLLHAAPWQLLSGRGWATGLRRLLGPVAINRIPTAWDFAARMQGGRFVRIRRAGGTIVGGWFGDGSYLSGYPETRDLFIEEEYGFDSDGEFLQPLPRSAALDGRSGR